MNADLALPIDSQTLDVDLGTSSTSPFLGFCGGFLLSKVKSGTSKLRVAHFFEMFARSLQVFWCLSNGQISDWIDNRVLEHPRAPYQIVEEFKKIILSSQGQARATGELQRELLTLEQVRMAGLQHRSLRDLALAKEACGCRSCWIGLKWSD